MVDIKYTPKSEEDQSFLNLGIFPAGIGPSDLKLDKRFFSNYDDLREAREEADCIY